MGKAAGARVSRAPNTAVVRPLLRTLFLFPRKVSVDLYASGLAACRVTNRIALSYETSKHLGAPGEDLAH